MASPSPTPRRFGFGPFEVDGSVGELRKHGVRIRLSGQPFSILMLLLEKPGDVVTREELHERIWSEGTFVDFEHGLNGAMNKLRKALGDSAEKPHYIETLPGRGYRFIGALGSPPSPPISDIPVPGTGVQRRPWPHARITERLAWAAACVVCVAVGLQLHIGPPPQPVWKMARVTAEDGLSQDPAISPAGDLVAYSSDSGLDGRQDLYVRQISGGPPVRLTFDGDGNTTPDFSGEGSRIVFRSNRNGGGIYQVPALGGESRFVARGGRDPRFSPDGSQVAYWVGDSSVGQTIPGSGAIWVVPASGGQPAQLGQGLTSARNPIWSPDGERLLFIGYASTSALKPEALDWWLVSTKGGAAVRTGAHEAFTRAGLTTANMAGRMLLRTPVPTLPRPGCWSRTDDAVLFSFPGGDTNNLWKIGLSPRTGKVTDPPRRLTNGSGNEEQPSCVSGDTIAFTNVERRREMWALPFDLNHGTPAGKLERLIQGPANGENLSFSRDGKYVAFTSDQSGTPNIWFRNLETGKELSVANSSYVQRFPVCSPSAAMVAYLVYEGDKRVVYAAAPGGTPVKLCDGCFRATDWSQDEKSLLTFGGSPYEIDLLDIAARQKTALLKHSAYSLLYGRFSPDQRWIAFTARISPGRGRIVVAPISAPHPIPESAWITIAEAGGDDYANWSPDGNTLYFTSPRDGHNCLWGQHIESGSRRPQGEEFAVQHLHGPLSFGHGGWSATGGRVGLSLVETQGTIWVMSRSGGR